MGGVEAAGPTISVVIPVLDDTDQLARLLAQLPQVDHLLEIIVVEGGGDRRSLDVAQAAGARWIETAPGRGLQMHRGAMMSTGAVLWFLHADCHLPERALEEIRLALEDPAVVGGSFGFRLTEARWYGCWLENAVNWRTRLVDLPYGDQGYFVRREIYEELGGFALLPILEDVEFIGRLRRRGRLEYLAASIGVSSRRWDQEGFLKATLRNLVLLTAFKLGVPVEKLQAWYPPPRACCRRVSA